jgi:hypothetical protein
MQEFDTGQKRGRLKIIKHDKYVDALYSKIKADYELVERNVPVYSSKKRNKKRLVAEIDILAFKEGKYDIYEVKCSYRFYKARRQLAKIRKLLHKESKMINNSFFYCGESKTLMNMNS